MKRTGNQCSPFPLWLPRTIPASLVEVRRMFGVSHSNSPHRVPPAPRAVSFLSSVGAHEVSLLRQAEIFGRYRHPAEAELPGPVEPRGSTLLGAAAARTLTKNTPYTQLRGLPRTHIRQSLHGVSGLMASKFMADHFCWGF